MSSFSLKYFCEFCSKYTHSIYRVEIEQRGYTGEVFEMHASGSPLHVEWEKRNDEFFVPIKGSEATLNILCYNNFEYTSLYTADARCFRMTIYLNGYIYWRGFLCADTYSESFAAPPYVINIKAVDGFALLGDIPFAEDFKDNPVGQISLLEILTMCTDTLELAMPLVEWIGLKQINSTSNTLTDTYIEIDRIYQAYESPTYRDVIELCLKPFAAQIFQAQGALHVRRVISLLNDYRPEAFYAHNTSRPLKEILWNNGAQVDGSATMEISPAIMSCDIEVNDKEGTNNARRMGLFDQDKWSVLKHPVQCRKDSIVILTGHAVGQKQYNSGYKVAKSIFGFKYKFSIKGNTKFFKCILRLKGGDEMVYFDGELWGSAEYIHTIESVRSVDEDRLLTFTYPDIDFDVQSIPFDGVLSLAYVDSEAGIVANETGGVTLYNFDISFKTEEDFDSSLTHSEVISYGNNEKLTIGIPTADIIEMPNNSLIFNLFLKGGSGNHTNIWKDNIYVSSLVGHIGNSARKLRAMPSRRISGIFDCQNVIDLNTVVEDHKYTNRNYYVNYISHDAIEDDTSVQLCELSESNQQMPPAGNDCILLLETGLFITEVVKCGYKLVFRATDSYIYLYDTYTNIIEKTEHSMISNSNIPSKLIEGVNCVVMLCNNKAIAIDINGKIISTLISREFEGDDHITYATYSVIRGWLYANNFKQGDYTSIYVQAKNNYDYYLAPEDNAPILPPSLLLVVIKESPKIIMTTNNYFVISTLTMSVHYDFRINKKYKTYNPKGTGVIFGISDRIVISSFDMPTNISVRNDIELTSDNIYRQYSSGNTPSICDTSNSIAVCQYGDSVQDIWVYYPFTPYYNMVINSGFTEPPIAVKIINEQVYIISENCILKYIPNSSKPTLSVTPQDLLFTSNGGGKAVTIIANAIYNIIETEEWIMTTKTDAGIMVLVIPNTGKLRQGFITIESGFLKINIFVTQEAVGVDAIVVDLPLINIPNSAGSERVNITANGAWTVKSDVMWATSSPENGTGNGRTTISFDANGGIKRTATITYTRGTATATTVVTQAAAVNIDSITIDTPLLDIPGAAGERTVLVTASGSWTAKSNEMWVYITPIGGNFSGTVKISCGANLTAYARTAIITFTRGTATATTTIKQMPTTLNTITVDTPFIEASNAPGSKQVNVITDGAWTARSNAIWTRLSPSKGTGNGTITISFDANSSEQRTATITYTCGTAKITTLVRQSDIGTDYNADQ